jgi:sRNA-binding protein
VKIPPTYFDVREYALLSVMFPTAEGADWGGWRQLGDWIDFTGKRAGRVTRNHADVPAKCAEADRRFEALRAEARALLANAKARA